MKNLKNCRIKMKRFFANNLTLLGEVAVIFLSLIWYFQNKEIEPLIVCLVSMVALFTSLFFKVHSPKLIMNIEYSSKGRKQEAPSLSPRNPRDNQGNIILYAGGGTSVYHWELHWYYNLIIRNNSSQVVYSPIIYTKNKSYGIKISNFLDEFEPIQPQEKIEIEIKYIISFEGTVDEVDGQLKELGKFPPEMKDLHLLISYKDESNNNYYSIFSTSNNETKIKGKMQKDFERLNLHEIQKLRKKPSR